MNISIELAQKIVNYLTTRPYHEVAGLISEIALVNQQNEMAKKVAAEMTNSEGTPAAPTKAQSKNAK